MRIQYRSTKAIKEVRDKLGQNLIDRGFAQLYQTRDMRAAVPAPVVAPVAPATSAAAPYGLKKDGTPKKAPGRSTAEK